MGDYPLEFSLVTGSSRTVRGRFLAVDRIDFPKVAWFRDDFASESLGSLMNRLATAPNSVLVSRQFLEENQLRIGDQLEMNVVVDFGAAVDSTFAIAGTYEYFPTVYEDEELTVIGNLEYLFSFYGLTMPHNIWLRTQNGADGAIILEEVETTGIETIKTQDTRASIDSEQAKMERVGVFGTLSVSFLAAAVMAALGLLTYSYASLQERLYHFALLHAVGLKRVQIIGQVFLEYFILTVYGAAAGIFIGSAAATYFVPLFRITGESGIPLPPLIPIIAQNEIVPLVVIFVSSMILLELLIIAVALYRGLFGILRMGYQG